MTPCPWSDFAPGTVAFCEARLCAWIAEPSNTWSSLGYVALGIYMFAGAWRPAQPRLLAVAFAQLAIGVGSFFFHASGTFAGEMVDQFGMFLLSGLILVFAAAQAREWGPTKTVVTYAALVLASTASLLVVRPAGIPLFGVQLAAGLGWQIRLWKTTDDPRVRAAHRLFFVALAIFGTSFAIWITDITGLLCDPDNHFITGHAVWHVLNAISILRLGQFYRVRFHA
ncbi:MAG: ceramidase domain-containing protein [Myxococcota bacterium]